MNLLGVLYSILEDACKDDFELRDIIGDSVGNPEEMRRRVRIFLGIPSIPMTFLESSVMCSPVPSLPSSQLGSLFCTYLTTASFTMDH